MYKTPAGLFGLPDGIYINTYWQLCMPGLQDAFIVVRLDIRIFVSEDMMASVYVLLLMIPVSTTGNYLGKVVDVFDTRRDCYVAMHDASEQTVNTYICMEIE
mgnify:CR=1 FL=1